MINELLEFTRGNSVSLAPAPVDYCQFIRQMLEEIGPEASQKQVSIECENEPPSVPMLLDQARLLHVFFNLINNAADFMPGGGKITLRFRVTKEVVVTELEDTGPGIAPEIAPKLFEPFATHGKSHGTGLGLSICKRIVEEHKGQIRGWSEPGRGAVFSITLQRLAEEKI
jgi:signal transduction histidine kinase